MFVQLRILDHPADVRSVLVEDGWRLEPDADGEVAASHRAVHDEASARQRLDKVGLLTSGHVSIRFHSLPPVTNPAGPACCRGTTPPGRASRRG